MKFFTGFLCLFFAYSPSSAQNIPYSWCNGCWNADSLGNQRVVLNYTGNGPFAKAMIEWRRNDHHPEQKKIIIQDAQTGLPIQNIKTETISRETGEICFEPKSGAGTYYAYYLPFKNTGSPNYPKSMYLKPDYRPEEKWLTQLDQIKNVPIATVKEFQSIDSFNTMYPMEVIATRKEVSDLKSLHRKNAFLIFTEDRLHSIRMRDAIPYRWIRSGTSKQFKGISMRGENFAFQIGIYALKNLENITINFSDLISTSGQKITSTQIFCINTGGIAYDGKPFRKDVRVGKDSVQALWCGIDVSDNTSPGIYNGFATITSKGNASQKINISLTVSDQITKEGNAIQPWKMTRLSWLNSTLAQNNTVIAPYTALKVEGNKISLLGREVILNDFGFPEQIQTFFTAEMTGYQARPNKILAEAIHFHFRKEDGSEIKMKPAKAVIALQQPGTVQWTAQNTSPALKMDVMGSLEFDGFLAYQVKVTALDDIDLSDITMHIPFDKTATKYLMGLGLKGGNRPDTVQWKWDVVHKNQDGAWIGNVNAGLQYSLRDENYVRPLNTNFYLQKPLLLPTSWGNESKGGINIGQVGKSVLADNYSGPRKMHKGDVLYYNFNLLITPFHPLNTDFQWETRFFHAYKPIQEIKETGATVINIHHGTAINPWINYPFIAWPKMKAYIDSAHKAGLKVKIYNTIRELSNHAYETFALRSLGTEIYSSGKGGGYSWLQEHLDSNYIAAWFVPEVKDAAIINSGMNRWHNYYVEGMRWLTQHVGIDGIYLDDVAFDRVTMKRIKRVLTEDGHPGIIDLHSANQYNKNDGFNNSANLYMEHFPYLNRLWFGEYFDYEHNSPDFFLTEVSGIPFGLMGEMLQDGGNPWRGMLYGMTNRMPWSDNADPRPIWKVWDDFEIMGSEMVGYWVDGNPVMTDNPHVLATIYKKPGKVLISIASWADNDTSVHLKLDWNALGIDPKKAILTAPEVRNFQVNISFSVDEAIPVKKNKGWLLILSEK